MVGFNGTAFDDTLKGYIEDLKVGGLILFSRNIQSPQQIEDLCSTAQEFAARCGQPPLILSIDQEGGVVSRLKPPFTQFKGNPHIKTDSQAARFARITAKELHQIGVNMNMAPVLDVLPIKGPSVMADRSFGHDPHHVAALGNEMILHFQQNGIMAVAKHFPGISGY
jgi:beta-N-acetylhexosaminidase